jgi:hypothetical protein
MDQQLAIERLSKQISFIDHLKTMKSFSPEFKRWKRDTEIVIAKIFGEGTRHSSDYDDIHYSLMAFSSDTSDYEFELAYKEGLEDARHIISSFIQEVEEYWDDQPNNSSKQVSQNNDLDVIKNICNRFHLVSRQLRSRHNNRETLCIEDEYDVQDLFHSLLIMYFDDIRPEEWTPSYAASSSRVDFLLKEKQIVIELKKTRKGLGSKELGEQLIIDIHRYQAHPDCKTLICFVYDPEGRIGNPKGIENDLSKGMNVSVIITPKGI